MEKNKELKKENILLGEALNDVLDSMHWLSGFSESAHNVDENARIHICDFLKENLPSCTLDMGRCDEGRLLTVYLARKGVISCRYNIGEHEETDTFVNYFEEWHPTQSYPHLFLADLMLERLREMARESMAYMIKNTSVDTLISTIEDSYDSTTLFRKVRECLGEGALAKLVRTLAADADIDFICDAYEKDNNEG